MTRCSTTTGTPIGIGRDGQIAADEVPIARAQILRRVELGLRGQVELLAQILPDVEGNRLEGGQIAQRLMTLEQRQQRQLLCGLPRMGRDKLPFLLGRRIERLEFLRAQRGFETRVGVVT